MKRQYLAVIFLILLGCIPIASYSSHYQFVSDIFAKSVMEDSDDFEKWLAIQGENGRFDDDFAQCNLALTRTWTEQSRRHEQQCNGFPQGGVGKAQCMSSNHAGYMVDWMLSFITYLQGGVDWADTPFRIKQDVGCRVSPGFCGPLLSMNVQFYRGWAVCH